MKTVEVARAGLVLALVMVFFTLFRGASNILNALLVPLLLYAAISGFSLKSRIALFFALIFLTAIINVWQIFFSLIYFFLAVLIYLTTVWRLKLPLRITLVSVVVFISFLVSIRLTDLVFGTRIETIVLQFAGGNYLIYAAIIALEGLIVGAILVWAAYVYDQKSKKWLSLRKYF